MKVGLLLAVLLLCLACSNEQNEILESELPVDETVKIESVQIGNQVWMKQNLSVSHYRNGDPIQLLEPADYWRQTTEGAWSFYNNDSIEYAQYGKLYNWYAINDSRGICPKGWRVPTLTDYNTLNRYLGSDSTSGDFLKDTSALWTSSTFTTTNSSGFSALPIGYRLSNGEFYNFGKIACFWTATIGDNNNAWDIFLIGKSAMFGTSQTAFENGYSCRCIKE